MPQQTVSACCPQTKGLKRLTESVLSSRFSANFSIQPNGNFGSSDRADILVFAKPPLQRKLRFQIVFDGKGENQARTLQAYIEKVAWFNEVDEIQLEFEVHSAGFDLSPARVKVAMRKFFSQVALPSGPTVRMTAYHQASARRIFPVDGHSTNKEEFDRWTPSTTRTSYYCDQGSYLAACTEAGEET